MQASLGATAMALLSGACGDDGADNAPGQDLTADMGLAVHDGALPDQRIEGGAPACADPFAGGTFEEKLSFANEGTVPTDTLFNKGLDGRLYSDLSNLSASTLVTPTERFFVRTRQPDQLDLTKPWSISVGGLVSQPQTLSVTDLQPDVQSMGTILLECSGNSKGGHFGLMGAATWSGVPLKTLLPRLKAKAGATRLLVKGFDKHSTPSAGGHSKPGASWIFTFDQLIQQGAFLATQMNGKPLTRDHGFPVRLLVPRWYGCTNIKWVDELRLVDDSEAATSQMKEFASRTHQSGVPTMARDYKPAAMSLSAMPVRVERWTLADNSTAYRVVGVMWGGSSVTDKLSIRFNPAEQYQPVTICPKMATNDTWTLWVHSWRPQTTGTHELRLRVDDSSINTHRLDTGFYRRWVEIKQT